MKKKSSKLRSSAPMGKPALKKLMEDPVLAFPFSNRFADGESFLNYSRAFNGEKTEYGFLPALVVNGAPASGKSTLVREYVKAKYSEAAQARLWPKSAGEMNHQLAVAVAEKWNYLWFDDVSFVQSFKSDLLAMFLTENVWAFRRLRTSKFSFGKISTEIILSGCYLKIPADLFRRFRVINLKTEAKQPVS